MDILDFNGETLYGIAHFELGAAGRSFTGENGPRKASSESDFQLAGQYGDSEQSHQANNQQSTMGAECFLKMVHSILLLIW
jgi:hypothetical protein